MPLTSKGEEILSNMTKTYGSSEKAKQVLYASKNAGKISGVDRALCGMDAISKATVIQGADAMPDVMDPHGPPREG